MHKLTEFAFASRKIPEYMHPRLLECAGCGLLYGSPVLSPDWLDSAYRSAAYDSGTEAEYAAATYVRALQPLLSNLSRAGRILDIGAGDGAFLRQLLRRGFAALEGVEPSAAPIAGAAPDVQRLLRQGVFRPVEHAAADYVLITCFQTLEHVPDPLELARNVHSLLKPGGAFAVVVHNRCAWSARVLGKRSPIYDIEHLQLFCPATAAGLLRRAGFSEIVVKPLQNRYPLRYWLRLFPFAPFIKAHIMKVAESNWPGAIEVSIPAGNLVCWGRR